MAFNPIQVLFSPDFCGLRCFCTPLSRDNVRQRYARVVLGVIDDANCDYSAAPAYVSARSADEILSAIRPTKIKNESLRSLNIFLDELLWLILHAARSLATNRLKAGLLQIMPSMVGKDAILEAEVELRTYKLRSPTPVLDEPGTRQVDFPLQPTFEVSSLRSPPLSPAHPTPQLLRQKCESYCTLGDLEENAAIEITLQEKMLKAGPGAPQVEQIAPAALYLTAILEYVPPSVFVLGG
jgi:hypothetical protein